MFWIGDQYENEPGMRPSEVWCRIPPLRWRPRRNGSTAEHTWGWDCPGNNSEVRYASVDPVYLDQHLSTTILIFEFIPWDTFFYVLTKTFEEFVYSWSQAINFMNE